MNFAVAVLWTCILSFALSICNAKLNYNVTMFTSSTFDVTIRCDLSAFVSTHPHVMADDISSLQILQHHAAYSKERMLAELNLAGKAYTPSPFLNSSTRFFIVEAANLTANDPVWLSLSLSSVHALPDNQLSYQCRVVYSQAANDTTAGSAEKQQQWSSETIIFAARSTDEQRSGIHVRVSEGVTVTCLIRRPSDEDADVSRNEVSVELLRQDETKRTRLCTGDSLGSATVKCQRNVFETGTLLLRDRAHFFNPTCADSRMYFCTANSPSVSLTSMVQIPSSFCTDLSFADIAARIGFCFFVFVVGCVLIVFVIYAIFLIFIPSSRPGARPQTPLVSKRAGSYHIASSTEKDMEKYLGY